MTSPFSLAPGGKTRRDLNQVSSAGGASLGQKILSDLRSSQGLGGQTQPPWVAAFLQDLTKENDSDLLIQDLLGAAQRLKSQSQDGLALGILERLARPDLPQAWRQKAQVELSAWNGGNFGMRSEFLLNRFCGNASDWRVIAPMLGASLVGRLAGAAFLGRFGGLAAEASSPWLGRGLGLRFAAGTAGYLAEVPTFALLSRALAPQATGGFGEDLARSALSLGALKAFGALGNVGSKYLTPVGTGPGWTARMLPSLSSLFGLMGAQRLETHFGLRPAVAGDAMFLDAVASLLSLGVGARLGHGVLGERFAGLERDLEIRSRLAGGLPKNSGESGATLGENPLLAMAVAGRPGIRLEDPRFQPWMMMNSNNGGGGRKGDSLAPVAISNVIVDPTLNEDPYIGQSFGGRYKVEALLGRGGMGKVYLATHEVLGKKFAIKVLRDTMVDDEEVSQRFLNEAKATSEIENPHIVDISDYGKLPDGSPYFVMEYLAGESLAKLVEGDQEVPVKRIVHIARQIAEGLEAAHRAGIIHRDLKPDNVVLITRGGEQDFAKILDFGIAKVLKSNLKLTQQGITFGSVHYMSPEQAMGIAVDRRSDIYSFGILLYELATGKVPFDSNGNADDKMNILHQQVGKAPVPLHEAASQEIPREFEALVNKCLAKRPEDRFSSMEEVRLELERIQEKYFAKPPSGPRSVHPSNEIVRARAPSPSPSSVQEPTGMMVAKPPSNPFPVHEPTEMVIRRVPSEPSPQGEAPTRRRWPLYLGLGGTSTAALIVTAALLANRRRDAAVPADAMPATSDAGKTPSPDAPPPPNKINVEPIQLPVKTSVSLSVSPADSHVFQDGKDLGSKTVSLEVEEGSSMELEIRRRGYKTKKLSVDGSQTKVSVRLERETTLIRRKPPEDKPPVKNPRDDEVVSPWKK